MVHILFVVLGVLLVNFLGHLVFDVSIGHNPGLLGFGKLQVTLNRTKGGSHSLQGVGSRERLCSIEASSILFCAKSA